MFAPQHADEPTAAPRPSPRLRRALVPLARVAGGIVAILLVLTTAAGVYDVAGVGPTATVPPLGPHDRLIRTGDVVTRYKTWGLHGTPLVLIPGFIEDSSVWDRVGGQLAEHFRVYALDVRGFGYTTHRPPYTLQADTAQVMTFIHALHLDAAQHARPILVGHSSGAAIAVSAALDHPHAVRGIVMLDGDGTSSGAGSGWEHALIVDPYYTAVLRLVLTHPSIMRRIWDRVCGPACPPFRGAEEQNWVRPLEVPGAADALKTILQSPLIGVPRVRQRNIRVPAAVVLGDQDPTITVARAKDQATWLHTHIFIAIPGSRHLPMIAEPALFVRDLDAAVSRLLRAG